MHSVAQRAVADYLTTVAAAAEGFLCIRVDGEPGTEHQFAWPTERDLAVAEISRAASLTNVWTCPYVMRDRRRAKGNAVVHTLVHGDVDHDQLDLDMVRELGGFAVASGTDGHVHVYVPLAYSVSATQHETLCRALTKRLDGDPAKVSDNDLLRPAGTLNHKHDPPTPVTWLIQPTGIRVDPQTLARQLGTALAHSGTHITYVNGANCAIEPIDVECYPLIAAAFHKVTNDRSTDQFRLIAACYDQGLTLPHARSAVGQRADLAGRLNGRRDDDVLACWVKIDTERRKARLTTIVPTVPTVPPALCVTKTEAEHWLREYLESRGGWAYSADVKRDAAGVGISVRTLQRAREDLNVVVRPVENQRRTIWLLPSLATGTATANAPLLPPTVERRCQVGTMLVSVFTSADGQSGSSKLSDPLSEQSSALTDAEAITNVKAVWPDAKVIAVEAPTEAERDCRYRAGLCVACGVHPYSAGRLVCRACDPLCDRCGARLTTLVAIARQRCHMCVHREQGWVIQNERYENGLCIECGKRPFVTGRRRCDICDSP
jgi:hypothetical protein